MIELTFGVIWKTLQVYIYIRYVGDVTYSGHHYGEHQAVLQNPVSKKRQCFFFNSN